MENLVLDVRMRIEKHQYQAHWYRHVSSMVRGKSILDIGTGSGYGLTILREGEATEVEGFHVAELPGVKKATIQDYADRSFDWVSAIDVVEHVEGDREFFRQLLRVAREAVFVSTPNWNVSHARNPYHVREYTPKELRDLLESFGFGNPKKERDLRYRHLRLPARGIPPCTRADSL